MDYWEKNVMLILFTYSPHASSDLYFRKREREGTISLIRNLLIKIVSTVHFEVDLFSFSHQKFSKLDIIMLCGCIT